MKIKNTYIHLHSLTGLKVKDVNKNCKIETRNALYIRSQLLAFQDVSPTSDFQTFSDSALASRKFILDS